MTALPSHRAGSVTGAGVTAVAGRAVAGLVQASGRWSGPVTVACRPWIAVVSSRMPDCRCREELPRGGSSRTGSTSRRRPRWPRSQPVVAGLRERRREQRIACLTLVVQAQDVCAARAARRDPTTSPSPASRQGRTSPVARWQSISSDTGSTMSVLASSVPAALRALEAHHRIVVLAALVVVRRDRDAFRDEPVLRRRPTSSRATRRALWHAEAGEPAFTDSDAPNSSSTCIQKLVLFSEVVLMDPEGSATAGR